MSDNGKPLNLDSTFVVMGPHLAADTVAVSDTVYADIDAQYGNFKNHLLISSHSFEEDWPTWEVHPHGDEIVCLISGDAELVLRKSGIDEAVRLDTPGEYVVVPKNTWHTARVHARTRMLFVTPGEATDNREQPPS